MASIIQLKSGSRAIQFKAKDGRRPTINLGPVSKRIADGIKVKVEHLNAAAISGQTIDDEVARWLASIDNSLANKLARVGLIPKREVTTLALYIDTYIAKRTDVKPSTKIAYGNARRNLVDYFGNDTPLRDITRSDADDWRRWLGHDQGLGESTVRRRCSIAQQFFRDAVNGRLLNENPLDHLKGSAQINAKRAFFVDRQTAQRVLDACSDDEWRLIFALSRYGGLRCPSEHMAMRWEDFDLKAGRMKVRSPKTERHQGGDFRVVPLFPERRIHVERLRAVTPIPSGLVITRYQKRGDTNFRFRLTTILKRAGVKPWPKLFNSLRASRATELAAEFPPHVAAAWLGHSTLVAQKHYWQVTEADFERAAGIKPALQNRMQQPSAMHSKLQRLQQKTPRKPTFPGVLWGLQWALQNSNL